MTKLLDYKGLKYYHKSLNNLLELTNKVVASALDYLDLIKADSSDITMILAALSEKVDKVPGKGLSTNDFTDEYKQKIDAKFGVYYNTTEYWNNYIGYIPAEGEVIVYSDYKSYTDDLENIHYIPGIKIGTGNGYVQDLPFIDEDIERLLILHIQDTTIHVTPAEKQMWNNKLNVTDGAEVENEILIFNRN